MRPKINHEQLPARFPEGTLARIDAVLLPKEKRADLIRTAVDAEIVRRSAAVAAVAVVEPVKRRKRARVSDPGSSTPAVASPDADDDELAMVARAFRTFR